MANAKPAAMQLRAEDAEDLKVLSAAVQDAVCTIGDIQYEKAGRRLTVALNRFRWEAGGETIGERVRAAIQFGGVLDLKAKKLRRDAPKAVLSLLAISFEPGEAPGGVIQLAFAGGGELRADVECIDAVMADISPPWPARRRPAHDLSGS